MKSLAVLIIVLAIHSGAAHGLPDDLRHQHSFSSSIKSVTGDKLEDILSADKGSSDDVVARELLLLEPTERISTARIARCEAYLPGPKARTAFTALVDMSAFLNPSDEEILSLPTPDTATQRKMLALATEYVVTTLHRLPNFYATRTTTTFRRDLRSEKPMRMAGQHHARVYYRDGHEVSKAAAHLPRIKGLTTDGEFGPILGTAMLDAARGNLAWGHWAKGPPGPLAVYSYAVAAPDSHYRVDGRVVAYNGEIAIDPSTGAIFRVHLKSEMDPAYFWFYSGSSPMIADVEVNYGPVDLGGRTYICPLKGVALSRGSDLLWVNDIVFDGYHLFAGETRVLPGFGVVE